MKELATGTAVGTVVSEISSMADIISDFNGIVADLKDRLAKALKPEDTKKDGGDELSTRNGQSEIGNIFNTQADRIHYICNSIDDISNRLEFRGRRSIPEDEVTELKPVIDPIDAVAIALIRLELVVNDFAVYVDPYLSAIDESKAMPIDGKADKGSEILIIVRKFNYGLRSYLDKVRNILGRLEL